MLSARTRLWRSVVGSSASLPDGPPLRFRWRAKVVKISKVTGQWMRHEGEARLYFYSVLGDTSDYFELCYDAKSLIWTLSKVWMAG